MAQLVYITGSLPSPSVKIVNKIITFVCIFLWGVKSVILDKLRLDILTQGRGDGGLCMFYPRDFLRNIKFKLVQKIDNSILITTETTFRLTQDVNNDSRYQNKLIKLCHFNGLTVPHLIHVFEHV